MLIFLTLNKSLKAPGATSSKVLFNFAAQIMSNSLSLVLSLGLNIELNAHYNISTIMPYRIFGPEIFEIHTVVRIFFLY
jgi:hypothetical protein